jgi:hypothetical protein
MLDILGSEDIPLEFLLMGVALLMMGAMLVVLLLKGRSDVRRRTSISASSDSHEGIAGQNPEQKKLYEAQTFSVDKLVSFVNDSVIAANDKGTKVLKTSLVRLRYISLFAFRCALCWRSRPFLFSHFMCPLKNNKRCF